MLIVNIDSGEMIAFVRFESALQGIFAVEVLPGIRYPDVINHDPDFIGRSCILPDDAMPLVPVELRSPSA